MTREWCQGSNEWKQDQQGEVKSRSFLLCLLAFGLFDLEMY